eukprot:scaffold1972_cov265-Chaetoceros_neogracile.AAC.22
MEDESDQKKLRKLEAKKLKQQLIKEAGGKRPRASKPAAAPTQSKKKPKPSNNNNNNNNRNKNSKSNSNRSKEEPHRFGRVMENAPCPNQSRMATLTIAIPGSIVSNAQTQELRTHLVGQIARAAAVYHVDEIVVFNDRLGKDIKPHYRHQFRRNPREEQQHEGGDGDGNGDGTKEKEKQAELQPSTDPHAFMARILQYCECPQYLRRHFFPMHPDLQFGGLLAPLDAPHHVRILDRSPFREGVVMDKKGSGENAGSLVNCGIRNQPVEILAPGIRCTVQIDPKAYTTPGKSLRGKVVSPSEPRERDGTYWGYTTRMASSIKAIFDEAPFPGGYDLKIGTSERGDVSVDNESFETSYTEERKSFRHAIIVIGGVAGIEECVDADETLNLSGNDSKTLFDMWVNVCEFQGSRTIRTEEAVLISLARLRPFLFSKSKTDGKKKTEKIELSATVEFSDEEPSDESSSEEE